MYERKKRTPKGGGSALPNRTSADLILLDFVFAFGAWGRVFDSLLLLGLFHSSLGFLGALGAGFAAFLALFVDQFFTAQKFDEGVVGAVAFSPSGADDAEVAAIAITEAWADGVEKFVDGGAGHEVSKRLTAGGEISALAQRDHLFDLRTHGFGFRHGGLDPLFEDERCDQIAQQRPAVRGVTSQFPSCYFVTHG